MIDVGFPIIVAKQGESPRERGQHHGEQFRFAIKELVEIRTKLMCEKNAKLTKQTIEKLAFEQWKITSDYDRELLEELEGIRIGANLSVEEIVILNNYTDFRDIQVDDQGCSLVYANDGRNAVGGQTWDMHGSAKLYACCMEIVSSDGHQQLLFSVVGCVGMMGYNSDGLMIGINNINTDGARSGVLWPVVVRKMLQQSKISEARRVLQEAPVTSGHNYLIADAEYGEMWEVMPDLSEQVADSRQVISGQIFHTNHCLGLHAKQRELMLAQTSTTHVRYGLLEKKVKQVSNMEDLYNLLNDHENYPQAICSNFQTSSIDPSITCGGAVGDLRSGRVRMWRGDPLYDHHFVGHDFEIALRVT
ncbi:MAG TPA: C45 family autoproteolytic acyltransferase/hydrolase [Pirellulaceae bacterium]|mgnify:CR=1 FL=1|nr:C45 family autoproteolytic acyltransferase/hydrolase [Pirellulaceae bacterium]HMO92149.1 C45 family autoproteolytic acyltransferase/hydrolase [Pirellulaceae bacterium]HMP68925.1 C45 family autoproteolytic acyltransferase/hydrolase [Pirellulaceae bacterium]